MVMQWVALTLGKDWRCSLEGQLRDFSVGRLEIGGEEMKVLDCDVGFMWVVYGDVLLVGVMIK